MQKTASDSASDQPDSIRSLLSKNGKMRIADFARNMANNQRIQDLTYQSDLNYRQQAHRMRERAFLGEEQAMAPWQSGQAADEMRINLDSPTNYYQAAQPKPNNLLPGIALLVGGLLGGAGLMSMLQPEEPERRVELQHEPPSFELSGGQGAVPLDPND